MSDGYSGPYLSCAGGVWTVQTATAVRVSAVDGAVFLPKPSAAPASASGPVGIGAGAGVGANGKPGVGVNSDTTYYCLTADGRILDVR